MLSAVVGAGSPVVTVGVAVVEVVAAPPSFLSKKFLLKEERDTGEAAWDAAFFNELKPKVDDVVDLFAFACKVCVASSGVVMAMSAGLTSGSGGGG